VSGLCRDRVAVSWNVVILSGADSRSLFCEVHHFLLGLRERDTLPSRLLSSLMYEESFALLFILKELLRDTVPNLS